MVPQDNAPGNWVNLKKFLIKFQGGNWLTLWRLNDPNHMPLYVHWKVQMNIKLQKSVISDEYNLAMK